jgi:hypothetical protein
LFSLNREMALRQPAAAVEQAEGSRKASLAAPRDDVSHDLIGDLRTAQA